jgi:hypothetical protein
LAVHHHQGFADLGEDAHRGGPAAQESAAASVRTQPAGQDQFRAAVELFRLGTRLQGTLDRGMAGVEFQHCLGSCAFGAAPDGTGVRPGAEEEADGGDHHGLAGAGLAGHHAQPGAQRQCCVSDDAQIADSQFFKHGSLCG